MSDFTSEAPEVVAAGVWRLPLPSRTLPPFDHTNSYLIQAGDEALLVDLGSDDPGVLASLWATLEALGVRTLKGLLLTHTHPDHCAGVEALQRRAPVPVYLHAAERERLGVAQVEEVRDMQVFGLAEHTVHALHTPGHSPGHLSFWLPQTRALLVGDLLAAHGSTWVGVPEGDVAAYLASLTRLAEFDSALLGPGHGPLVRDPEGRIKEVRRHRLGREAEVLTALKETPSTVAELRAQVYPGVSPDLTRMAESSLLAHLVKLEAEGRVAKLAGGGPYTIRS